MLAANMIRYVLIMPNLFYASSYFKADMSIYYFKIIYMLCVQSLSTDIALHVARISQLVYVAHGLQALVHCNNSAAYDDHYAAIINLQAEVS